MGIRWSVTMALAKWAIRALKGTGWYDGYWNHWRGELFEYAQARGLHILPVHFYSPVPDTRALPASLWEGKGALPGLRLDLDAASVLLRTITEPYRAEYEQFPREKPAGAVQYYLNNASYSSGDAEVLYSVVRHYKPKRIIEIGAGQTTLVIAQALRRNAEEDSGQTCAFVSIEPYPPEYLQPAPAEVSRMLVQPLQEVPLAEFEALESGDVLFIDSSHVVSIGSDVVYEYLEILPRLKPGVIVHIHDIFLPYEYPQRWYDKARFFWNEQYLLQALLQDNARFEILLPLHALYRDAREVFCAQIRSCESGGAPGAFWMRRM